jgi:hypothetical protein
MDSQRMNRFKRAMTTIGKRAAVALGVTAVVVVVGCSDDSGLGQRYKVSGTVTYKGEKVSKGTVNFEPAKAGEGRAATGTIENGYYELSTAGGGDGALPGDYNVTIKALDIDMSSAVSTKEGLPKVHEGDAAFQKAVKSGRSLVPTKYSLASTSGLTAKVDGAKTIDFPLTD